LKTAEEGSAVSSWQLPPFQLCSLPSARTSLQYGIESGLFVEDRHKNVNAGECSRHFCEREFRLSKSQSRRHDSIRFFSLATFQMMSCCKTTSFLLTLASLCLPTSNARVLSPQEQAIGDWDLSLRSPLWRRQENDDISHILFPPRQESSHKHDKRDHHRSLSCRLSIYPNGTFALKPKDDEHGDSTSSGALLTVRGTWKLQPNPYCVTDRQYDQLKLESYPRVQKFRNATLEQDSPARILQRVNLQLHCRIWGRYGSDSIRKFAGHPQGSSMSRITHGTVVWNDLLKNNNNNGVPWWKSKRPAVCATFSARPRTDATHSIDDEDYDDDLYNVQQ
jgi:hypothetical protein